MQIAIQIIGIICICVAIFVMVYSIKELKNVKCTNDNKVEANDFKDDPLQVNFVKIHKNAKIPTRGSDGAAGYDLYACCENTDDFIKIAPGKNHMFHTGLSIAVPHGYFVAVYPRSGLASKRGLRLSNAVGVVDEDYRGELMVSLYNDSDVTQSIKSGDRIAQIIFQQYKVADFVEVEKLNKTLRGEGGFGSTGTV